MLHQYKSIVLGGGCFWCTEAVYKMIKGVQTVTPGYAGGDMANPTYEMVCKGNSGHVEVVRVSYDPKIITIKQLLTVFFATHDPTSVNRQGNDVGTQYRSAIFYSDDEQRIEAENMIYDINVSTKEGISIVTSVGKLRAFYPAENYHKDYFERNQNDRYCEIVINPKLEKVKKDFAELVKSGGIK